MGSDYFITQVLGVTRQQIAASTSTQCLNECYNLTGPADTHFFSRTKVVKQFTHHTRQFRRLYKFIEAFISMVYCKSNDMTQPLADSSETVSKHMDMNQHVPKPSKNMNGWARIS